ncbi:MAG: hypothetical protein AAGD10_01705 [Myxococcota bacterium]
MRRRSSSVCLPPLPQGLELLELDPVSCADLLDRVGSTTSSFIISIGGDDLVIQTSDRLKPIQLDF